MLIHQSPPYFHIHTHSSFIHKLCNACWLLGPIQMKNILREITLEHKHIQSSFLTETIRIFCKHNNHL